MFCFNYLTAWLVSMEICPKGIFISIWHLPVQIKVHKENIGTKHLLVKFLYFVNGLNGTFDLI